MADIVDAICTSGLALPVYGETFYLTTDFSYNGIGGVLSQMVDGVEHPILFCSRVLNGAEQNYSPTEGEALAILFALRKCSHLLFG